MEAKTIACVIDDDEIFTFLYKRLMADMNIVDKTLFFENGKVAIDYFKQNADNSENLPDLVFLDLNMPVLDGWQFMDEFVKIGPLKKKITLYIVSSSIDESDMKKALMYSEVSDFIVKPVTQTVIRKIVEDLKVQPDR